jgi:ribA/ribD-fused uncharacterized protein
MHRGGKATFYEGKFYALSNFSSFSVKWSGRRWMTAEHAYQAGKFSDRQIILRIYQAPSAHEAKQIAKKNSSSIRLDWCDVVKLALMEEILREKRRQHAYVRETLARTGDMEIVEDSPVDSFWGRGPDWKGENHLGKIWMKLRDEHRSKR